MHITYVTDQFLPADATDTIQLVTMASAFGEAGADVRLVFPQRPGSPPDANAIAAHYGVAPSFEAVALPGPYPAPFGFRGLEKLSHAAISTRHINARAPSRMHGGGAPEVIYTRNLPVVLAALAGARLPVFYETYRPWPAQSVVKRALFSALRRQPRLAGLVLHSRLAAESYRRIGFADERTLVAHNGIDPARFADPLAKAAARRSLNIGSERPMVLYAGHVSPDKGLGLLLDAAERLPGIDLVIVGSRGDGPIERRALTLPNVRVFPWQTPSEVGVWLAAADILAIPPTGGPLQNVGNTVLPIKTFQYLAAGRAIIAPSTPDLLEVLEDGRNARLVPPDDFAAFVAALDGLVRDPATAERLGEAARAEGLANTWQGRARRIMAFIEERTAG